MIRIFLIISLFAITTLIFSCRKSDELPPQITLKGNDTVYGILNQEYNDPGITAWDDTDGDLSKEVKITSLVNINKTGYYPVYYDAVDESGNKAVQQKRIVGIVHEAWYLAGNYQVSDTTYYPDFLVNEFMGTLEIDSAINKQLVLFNFLNVDSLSIYLNLDETSVVIPFQEIYSDGNGSGRFIQGNGSFTDTTLIFSYLYTHNQITALGKQSLKRIAR